MKVYLVGTVYEYLGSKVIDIGISEKELDYEPKLNHPYFDKIGNYTKHFFYFKTLQEADECFFIMVRNLKIMKGLKNFPSDWEDIYNKVYDRAIKDYDYVII